MDTKNLEIWQLFLLLGASFGAGIFLGLLVMAALVASKDEDR